MQKPELSPDCQITNLHQLYSGTQEPVPFIKSIRLWLRKSFGPRRVRAIKKFADDFLNWFARIRGKPTKPPIPPVSGVPLKAGDWVRVRSKEEIHTTLNHWGQLKGCSFSAEMVKYCGTSLQVLKPVERFVDERDLRVRKARGLVLLEGSICQGTASLGRCDRNCYFFWREEWLEKNGHQ